MTVLAERLSTQVSAEYLYIGIHEEDYLKNHDSDSD